MSGTYTKQLNKTGGSNAYRFQGQTERSQIAQTNIARKLRAGHERSALPDVGETGSFFQQELQKWKELDITQVFAAFARKTLPLSSSMALLLHHKESIVNDLLGLLRQTTEVTWKSVCSLLAVLARDLKEEMIEFVLDISAGLHDKVDASQPEMTAEIFRTLSFICKYLGSAIVCRDLASPIINQWLFFLGNKRTQLRELTASSLAILLRKHDLKGLKRCVAAILRAGSHCKRAEGEEMEFATRSVEFKDGCALLLFEVLRNTTGTLHSCHEKLLPYLLRSILPKPEAGGSGGEEEVLIKQIQHAVVCEIVSHTLRYCVAFVDDGNASKILDPILACLRDFNAACAAEGGANASAHALTAITSCTLAGSIRYIYLNKQRAFYEACASSFLEVLATLTSPSIWNATSMVQLNRVVVQQIMIENMELAFITDDEGAESRTRILEVVLPRLLKHQNTGTHVVFHPTVLGMMYAMCYLLPAPMALDDLSGVLIPAGQRAAYAPQLKQCHEESMEQNHLRFTSDLLLASTKIDPQHRMTLIGAIMPLMQHVLASTGSKYLLALSSLLLDLRDAADGYDGLPEFDVGTLGGAGESFGSSLHKHLASLDKAILHKPSDIPISQIALSDALLKCLPMLSLRAASSVESVAQLSATIDHLILHEANRASIRTYYPLLIVKASIITSLIEIHKKVDGKTDKTSRNTASTAKKVLESNDTMQNIMDMLCIVSTCCKVSRFADIQTWCDADEGADAAFLSLLHAANLLCGWLQYQCPALLEGAVGYELSAVLASMLSHHDHAIRYHVLQLLQWFSAPPLTWSRAVPVSTRLVSWLPAAVDVIFDEIAAPGEMEEPHLDALNYMYNIETLPNTLAFERAKAQALHRLVPIIESRRMPPAHAACVAYHCLGLLHAKFSPLWASITPVFAALAGTYPRSLWVALSRQLYWASRRYPNAQHEQLVVGSDIRTKSQSRHDSAVLHMIPLKLSHYLQQVSLTKPSAAPVEGEDPIILRFARLQAQGIDGADAAPSVWARECMERSAEAVVNKMNGRVLHENDTVRLHLGFSGRTDGETHHSQLMNMLASAPVFSEARSRVLVALFVAFLHGVYYQVHADDVDIVELGLHSLLESVGLQSRKVAAKAVHAEASEMDKLVQSIVEAAKNNTLVETLPPKSSLQQRLLGFLKVFQKFRGWDGVVLHDQLYDIFVRFLSKLDGGVAEASLRVLSSMKMAHIMPYEKSLLNLLNDDRYRSEMVTFHLSPDADFISDQHRHELLRVIFRIMLGRLLQRHGRSAKDSPALRRSQVLAYCSSASPAEAREFLYLLFRPLLLGYVNQGLVPAGTKPNDWMHIVDLPAPANITEAGAYVKAIQSGTPSGPDGARFKYLTASRAVGFLHVCRDVAKHFGLNLLPWLHHVLAGITALVDLCDVGAADSPADDASEVSSVDAPGAVFDQHHQNIRSLAYLRLADLIGMYPDTDIMMWTTLLQNHITKMACNLPGSMACAVKASAFLTFTVACSRSSCNRQLIFDIPAMLPACFTLLSTGIDGAFDVYREHLNYTGQGEGLSGAFTHSGGPSGPVLGAAFEILEKLFGIDEIVVADVLHGIVDSTERRFLDERLRGHIGYLLQHILLRMNIRRKNSAGPSAESTASDEWVADSAPFVPPPSMSRTQTAFSRRQLALLAVVSQYVEADTDSTVIQQLVLSLIPFASRNVRVGQQQEVDPRLVVFGILRRLGAYTEDPEAILPMVIQLLKPGSTAMDGHPREALLETMLSLFKHRVLQPLHPAALVLAQSYRLDSKKLGDVDYDAILTAFQSLKGSAFFGNLLAHVADGAALQLLDGFVHQLTFLCHDKDMALRTAAYNILCEWITHSAKVVSTCPPAYRTKDYRRLPMLLRGTAPQAVKVVHLVVTTLVPDLHVSLLSSSHVIRRQFMGLLAEEIKALQPCDFLHNIPLLHLDLFTLFNFSDPEADVFYNLSHLQVHRRVRALSRLATMIGDGRISALSIEKVIFPIAMQMLFDHAADTSAAKDGAAGSLQNEIVNLIGVASTRLDFSGFVGIFRRIVRQVAKMPELDKAFGRIIEAMASNIPRVSCDPAEDADKLQISEAEFQRTLLSSVESNGVTGRRQNASLTATVEVDNASVASDDDEASAAAHELTVEGQRRKQLLQITTHLLPPLQNMLFKKRVDRDEGGDANARLLRPSFAISYVYLLRVLPTQVSEARYPRILSQICSGARSRDQDVRESARIALSKVALLLGLRYLQLVLDAVTSSLGEGYQVHITGHILHSILEALEPSIKAALDRSSWVQDGSGTHTDLVLDAETEALCGCLPSMLRVVYDDVFGEAAEARDADSGYKPKHQLKESHSCRAYDIIELLGRSIPFLPHPALHEVTGCILSGLSIPRRTVQIQEAVGLLLKRLASGLLQNGTLQGENVILYAFGVCAEYLCPKTEVNPVSKPVSKAPDQLQLVSKTVYDKWVKPLGAGSGAARVWSSLQTGAQPTHLEESGLPLTAAMRLKGTGVRSKDESFTAVLPEPRKSGWGRFVGAGVAKSQLDAMYSGLLGTFCLGLLHACINRGKIHSSNPSYVELLDALIPMFLSLMERSRENSVIVQIVKILNQIMSYPLETLRKSAAKVTRLILHFVEKTTGVQESSVTSGNSSTSELAQSSMKTATTLIRACDFVKLSEDQQRALLVIVRADLAIAARQNAIYGLLRALLTRRFIVVELYDCMDDVAKQMVTSLRPNVRALACNCFLIYLLKYPLTEKRLQGYMDFFIRNLEYSLEDGRLSMLDMLGAVITKFPEAVLNEYSSYLLLPLVLRVTNDVSVRCRAAAGAMVKLLISKVGLKEAQAATILISSWLEPGAKHELMRAGCQAIGLVLEARPQCIPDAGILAQKLGGIVHHLIAAHNRATLVEEDGSAPDDEGAESAAVAAAAAHTALMLGGDVDHIQPLTSELHETTSSTGAVGSAWGLLYFALVAADKLYQQFPALRLKDVPLGDGSKRFKSSANVAATIDSPESDDDEDAADDDEEQLFGACCKSNSIAAAADLLLYPHSWIRVAATKLVGAGLSAMAEGGSWCASDILNKICHRLISQLRSTTLGEKQAEITASVLLSASTNAPQFVGNEDPKSLRSLLGRAVGVALLSSNLAQTASLKWMAALVVKLPPTMVNGLLDVIMKLLFRLTETVEDTSGPFHRAQTSAASAMAAECVQLLQERLGSEPVLNALNAERARVAAIRLQRKKDRAVLKVVDPEAAAVAKAKKQASKLRNKRKHVDQYKLMRGRTSAGGAGRKRNRDEMS